MIKMSFPILTEHLSIKCWLASLLSLQQAPGARLLQSGNDTHSLTLVTTLCSADISIQDTNLSEKLSVGIKHMPERARAK